MENNVKGKGYDVRNNDWDYRYCSDDYQHYRHNNQYRTILTET